MIAIIAWLAAKTKAPQWLIYAILAAGVLGGISYGLYRYGTAQWNKGVQAGRQAATTEMENAKKAEWDLAQRKIASAAQEVEAERTTVKAERAALNASRLAISQALSAALASAKAKQETSNAVVVAIPSDQLDATIRALSADLSPK